jgi:hypothetical protein
VHFLASGENATRRPYVKYVDNGKNRIDFFFTDGHPRDVRDNNVYHLYYEDGAFYTSDGTKVREMEDLSGNPIKVSEGTLVFDGSGAEGRGWVWDLEYDQDGHPVGAFISSPSGDIGTEMEYRLARWDGSEWQQERIAHAGSNLYPAEQHYAGGIAIDPFDAERVIVSADVDPASGEPLPGRVYQLFEGRHSGEGWTWTQLTFDPAADQLRPTFVRQRPNTFLWFAGRYDTYTDYDARIMGSFPLE